MRSGRLTGISIAASVLIAGMLTIEENEPGRALAEPLSEPAPGVLELQAYVDPDFGFSLAIPAGWQAVVAAESGVQTATHEPGYAIAFESPSERGADVFSDYLMVEILPGDESGLFDTDGSRRSAIRVDGRAAWRDELVLAMTVPDLTVSAPTGRGRVPSPSGRQEHAAVELVIRQASFSGLGFTVGLYSIGERSRRVVMDEAFEIMLRTFRLPVDPFDVS